MPSNDETHEAGDRLDPFLIDGPPVIAPQRIAGLDDFLAVPPIPAEPAAQGVDVADPSSPASHQLPAVAEHAAIASHFVVDAAVKAADLPIIASFPPQAAAPLIVHGSFGDDDSLIAPPAIAFPSDADLGASFVSHVAAGADEGGGGDLLSALAANSIDDGLLTDPSALLSAVPFASPAVTDQQAADRFDPWSTDSSWSASPSAVARFGAGGLDSGSSASGPLDVWARGDDRSPSGSEALDRIEGRLSQAVARLEEAVATLSAPGPSPLGSRPRGFRGRIDG